MSKRSGPLERRAQKMMDVRLVADRLGTSEAFVRRLVLERRIPFYKLGRLVRFDPNEIDQWVVESRVEPLSW